MAEMLFIADGGFGVKIVKHPLMKDYKSGLEVCTALCQSNLNQLLLASSAHGRLIRLAITAEFKTIGPSQKITRMAGVKFLITGEHFKKDRTTLC
jgi:hypothetical protein